MLISLMVPSEDSCYLYLCELSFLSDDWGRGHGIVCSCEKLEDNRVIAWMGDHQGKLYSVAYDLMAFAYIWLHIIKRTK